MTMMTRAARRSLLRVASTAYILLRNDVPGGPTPPCHIIYKRLFTLTDASHFYLLGEILAWNEVDSPSQDPHSSLTNFI